MICTNSHYIDVLNLYFLFCSNFPTNNNSAIEQLATDLATKLFTNERQIDGSEGNNSVKQFIDEMEDMDADQLIVECDPQPQTHPSSESLSDYDILQANLRARIDQANQVATPNPMRNGQTQRDIPLLIRQEFLYYETNSKLGPLLSRLLNALKIISPTSTKSERVFSMSSNGGTKTRLAANDKSINALCFLKSYFMNKRKNNVLNFK